MADSVSHLGQLADPAYTHRRITASCRRPSAHSVRTASDGVRLAYISVGEGAPLVFASNIFGDTTHYLSENGHVREVTDRLARLGWRVIRYDHRGMGASDRDVEDVGLDARVRDHLSDRELYTQLLRELLPEEMPALDVDENSAWHIDVLGYDKPDLHLKYYADEKTRESWRIDFPDDPIPPREDPPHHRDSHLPQNRF